MVSTLLRFVCPAGHESKVRRPFASVPKDDTLQAAGVSRLGVFLFGQTMYLHLEGDDPLRALREEATLTRWVESWLKPLSLGLDRLEEHVVPAVGSTAAPSNPQVGPEVVR